MKFNITSSHHPEPAHLTTSVFIKKEACLVSRFLFLCQRFSQVEQKVSALLMKGLRAQCQNHPGNSYKLSFLLAPKTKNLER